jgi:hypothetical protein
MTLKELHEKAVALLAQGVDPATLIVIEHEDRYIVASGVVATRIIGFKPDGDTPADPKGTPAVVVG